MVFEAEKDVGISENKLELKRSGLVSILTQRQLIMIQMSFCFTISTMTQLKLLLPKLNTILTADCFSPMIAVCLEAAGLASDPLNSVVSINIV